MIYLLLSVLFSSALFLVFSFQKRYHIPPLLTIVVNYFTAATVGYLSNLNSFSSSAILASDWFPLSLLLGSCFILSFNLMGITTQRMGVNVAAVVSKMSMVFPVLFAILYYKEKFGPFKIIGVLLALLAVVFTSRKENSENNHRSWYLPVLLFIGCGTVDLLIGYSQRLFSGSNTFGLMAPTLFLVAGSGGLAYLTIINRKLLQQLSWRAVGFGILLGTFNYYSLYFLYQALNVGLGSAETFTLNNIGVVAFSAFLAYFCFKERLSKLNLIGLLLSFLAILFMMY